MKTEDLTVGPVGSHIRNIAAPASIGLVFQTMYNVVDSFYAGRVSTSALAALGWSFPVFLLIIATSSGLSRGATALLANAIGAKDHAKMKRYLAQCLSLGIFVSVALTAVGLQFSSALFGLLGAKGEALATAEDYITPIFCGSVCFVIAGVCNAMLVSSGDSRTFGKLLVMGFFLNLGLDPWFLYGGWGLPPMGIAGIAWATVAIQAINCSVLLMTVKRRQLFYFRPLKNLLPDLSVFWEIARQAAPASINIMSVALGYFVVTYFLTSYGEATVAAFGITTRIEQIGLLPTLGFSAAIMAVVGQNYGAGKYDRILDTMRICNRVGLGMNLVASTLMFVFSRQLMQIFTTDTEVIRLGVGCLNIISLIQWSYVMTATHLAMLAAMKRPLYGFFESILRKLALPLPLMGVLVVVYQAHVDWVWYSIATTNVLMTIVTIGYAQYVLSKTISADGSDRLRQSKTTCR